MGHPFLQHACCERQHCLNTSAGISSNVTSNADEAQDMKSDHSANDRAKSEARAHEKCLDTLFQQLLRQHTRALRAQLLRAKHKEQMLLESLDRVQQEIAQSCGRGLARYSRLT